MAIASDILIALVAFLHVYFLVLEMFLWDKPYGLKTFGHTQEIASQTKVLAANQGLYNGFLAAGLVWGLFSQQGMNIKIFFLSCIIIAGIYGSLTAHRKILFVQAIPGCISLVFLLLSA